MREYGRDELIKLYWRGNRYGWIFILCISLLVLVYFFYWKVTFIINEDRELLRKELYSVEFAEHLTRKESVESINGSKLDGVKSNWLYENKQVYERHYFKPSILKSINVSCNNNQSEILNIYDKSLINNGWYKTGDNSYKKGELVFSIKFIEDSIDNNTKWEVEMFRL